jgi:hypothetical protein
MREGDREKKIGFGRREREITLIYLGRQSTTIR